MHAWSLRYTTKKTRQRERTYLIKFHQHWDPTDPMSLKLKQTLLNKLVKSARVDNLSWVFHDIEWDSAILQQGWRGSVDTPLGGDRVWVNGIRMRCLTQGNYFSLRLVPVELKLKCSSEGIKLEQICYYIITLIKLTLRAKLQERWYKERKRI